MRILYIARRTDSRLKMIQCKLVRDNTLQVPATARHDRVDIVRILGRMATRPDDGLLRIGQMQQVEHTRLVVNGNRDTAAPDIAQAHKVVEDGFGARGIRPAVNISRNALKRMRRSKIRACLRNKIFACRIALFKSQIARQNQTKIRMVARERFYLSIPFFAGSIFARTKLPQNNTDAASYRDLRPFLPRPSTPHESFRRRFCY